MQSLVNKGKETTHLHIKNYTTQKLLCSFYKIIAQITNIPQGGTHGRKKQQFVNELYTNYIQSNRHSGTHCIPLKHKFQSHTVPTTSETDKTNQSIQPMIDKIERKKIK